MPDISGTTAAGTGIDTARATICPALDAEGEPWQAARGRAELWISAISGGTGGRGCLPFRHPSRSDRPTLRQRVHPAGGGGLLPLYLRAAGANAAFCGDRAGDLGGHGAVDGAEKTIPMVIEPVNRKELMKLICFPHAGGFAFYFNFLRQIKTLHKGDLYLYEYPGRGYQGKEPNAESLMAIAQTAAARIADFAGDEPFCIFGHSMGAFVAYETEALLEAHYGKQAARLILSGQHPPVCFQPHHYGFGSEEELNEYLMKLGGFPEEVQTNLQMFRMLFTVCRDDIRLLEQYRPTCNVVQAETVVLCGNDDAEVGDTEELTLWQESAPNLLEVKIFAGTHFYMREQEADFLHYIQQIIEGEKAV